MVSFNVHGHPQRRLEWSFHFTGRKARLKEGKNLSIQGIRERPGVEPTLLKTAVSFTFVKYTDLQGCLMNFDKCIYLCNYHLKRV